MLNLKLHSQVIRLKNQGYNMKTNSRFQAKFQNFSYVTLEAPKVETEKDLVLAAVKDLKSSGIKMSEKQRKEVEDFLKRYK